jgi:hypothetical protein
VELAAAGLFRAKWTNQIHEEWMSNVLTDRSDLTRGALERTRDLMNRAVLDCLVEGYEDLVPGLLLPDSDDRHVLAAAIHCGADSIVTFNLKDFPRSALEKYGIDAIHPDDFINHQFGLAGPLVVVSAQRCRARLRNPPRTAEEYLETLERQGLPKTIFELRQYTSII